MDIREDLRLSKSNRESVKNAQSNIVNEVKGLLAENAADKRKILKNMGPGSHEVSHEVVL